jgi:hypothetical protein
MWVTKFLTTTLIALTGLLPSSCTKTRSPAAQQKQPAANAINSAVNSPQVSTVKNLGELDLTNHFETCVNLGEGRSCFIKPTAVSRSKMQLTMSLESRSPNGKTRDLSVVQVIAKQGKPFEVAVGDMNLTLTPILAGE